MAGAASVSVCICTRDRPSELARALESVGSSTIPVPQVIVADDSEGKETRELVAQHPGVELIPGPRRGLGANRNAALEHVRGSHVLFLDDDAQLSSTFLTEALGCATTGDAIVTGRERQPTGLVEPRGLSFLGHQSRPYRPGEPLTTIVINSTLFPRTLFRSLRFDPQLVYGCEEADLAARAVAAGFAIRYCPTAVNLHCPSPHGRDAYRPYTEASRLYATWKRYARTQRRPLRGVVYLLAGSAHALAHGLRQKGPLGLTAGAGTVRTTAGYIRRYRRDPELDRCASR